MAILVLSIVASTYAHNGISHGVVEGSSNSPHGQHHVLQLALMGGAILAAGYIGIREKIKEQNAKKKSM